MTSPGHSSACCYRTRIARKVPALTGVGAKRPAARCRREKVLAATPNRRPAPGTKYRPAPRTRPRSGQALGAADELRQASQPPSAASQRRLLLPFPRPCGRPRQCPCRSQEPREPGGPRTRTPDPPARAGTPAGNPRRPPPPHRSSGRAGTHADHVIAQPMARPPPPGRSPRRLAAK